MPLDASSIIVTIGGSTSNSYVTLAQFADYRDTSRITATGFDAAEPDTKIRALLMAAERLSEEGMNWIGSRASSTQALAWPRTGARKIEQAGACYGQQYLTTEIPLQVKKAQMEVALALLDNFSEGGDSGAIEKWKADDVEITYRQARPDGLLPSEVTRLIGALIQGPRLIRS